MKGLNSSHPLMLAVYFFSVMFVTMFTTNPVMLALALSGGVAYSVILEDGPEFVKSGRFYVVLFVVIAITNPLFSHNGATPLFFINGNAITLEAVLYGLDIAAMLIAVMYWFKCFNEVVTSDKLLFLFGRVSPKLALVMSSALRFIPHFKRQAGKIRQAQKAMGLYSSDSLIDKLGGVLRVFSSLVTWAFENAIDTGTSMKARGHSLKGRSYYGMFKFRVSDGVMIAVVLLLDVLVFMIMSTGRLDYKFYPEVSAPSVGVWELVVYVAWGCLTWMPCFLYVKENIQWMYYRSKI